MGYTRIAQYGNVVEIYEYEKNRTNNSRPTLSLLSKNRAKRIRQEEIKRKVYKRKKSSIARAVTNFYRLCHHNNVKANTVAFVTLTFIYDCTIEEAGRACARFVERYKKAYPKVPISYISVSEKTKKGRWHYHLLVYNLPPETKSVERETRNLQRLFERGYVDIRFANRITKGIAGYMAKYMAKTLYDEGFETRRGYNCSRNIESPTIYGSNTLDAYTDIIVPIVNVEKEEKRSYDVPYLGKCLFTKIVTKI